MRYFLCALTVWAIALSLNGQAWADTDIYDVRGKHQLTPKTARGLIADTEALRSALKAAPHETNSTAESSPAILLLPSPDGETSSFRIVTYDAVGDPDRYPDIRTWYGINTDDFSQTIFLDWTKQGFHASVRGGKNPPWYIDPVISGDLTLYQAYFRKDLTDNTPSFGCSTKTDEAPGLLDNQTGKSAGDCVLRQYRVAITATPQYSNYHGAFTGIQSGLIQSAIVTTVNRINQIYTQELSIRLQLIAENDKLYFYDEATSPFSSNLVADLVNENIAVQEDRIPLADFDLGHVYTKGINNGRAFPRASCVDALKSGGATSRVDPIGDPFTIDYVAHEMGHQFGAFHTQNNLCNYSADSGMEPGSGSTIMGYAGICFPNVQLASDDYFHGRSIEEITNFTENPFTGGICAEEIDNSLFNPQVGSVPDRTIPQGTPFRLTGQASGAGRISYNWEQYDPELGTMPPQADNKEGPLFRSFPPSADPHRYFPVFSAVLNNTDPEWETLPEVGREMNFRLTVNHSTAAYGCAGEEDVKITVDDDFGPFVVSDPADTNQWSIGQIAQIQWEVAGTDSPVFTSPKVDVLISTDNGQTFIPLAPGLPNNGLAEVRVPQTETDSARIMVRSSGNYFYNVSPQPFRIIDSVGPPSLSIAPVSPAAIGDCFSATDEVTFDFLLTGAGGATDSLEMTVTGLPEELTASFHPTTPRPGGRVRLTVSGMSDQSLGVYEGLVSGVSADGTVSQVISITKYSGEPDRGPELNGPSGLLPDIRPTLRVRSSMTDLYQFQVSEQSDFSTLLYDESTDQPFFTLPAYLSPDSRYFWRARTRDANGGCGISKWTSSEFITGDCPVFSTASSPATISTGPPIQSVEMTLDISRFGEITDLDLVMLDLEHSYLNDVEVDLESPSGVIVPIFDRSCGGNDDILLNFDDEAGAAELFCPPVAPDAFVRPPSTPLAAYDGDQLRGSWTLHVRDRANQDGGQLNGFSIKACLFQEALPVTWLSFTATGRKADILLEWSTESETANDGFYLERAPAAEPTNWEEIGFVGAGNDYSFVDITALPGTDYYFRLRQTDQDGRVSYSEIRSARIGQAATDGLHLFPNPTADRVRYRWTTPEGLRSDRLYSLTDSQGRLLQEGQLHASGGSLSISTLPAGVYFLRVTGLKAMRVVRL
ncbi:T9SS type A sorting domain-containing protein [Neolewinella aurantiaca]|uniref:T9SS type A sorting domain-containing protein n=1 Tax=Neolewinella aurantiaca TaxID=2602767 RepID=A0A5C7FD86_9BACT|nr:zinc-dependent metalloprotease family protein [Neolewinella aurantiaca]TXF88938.1 T9SS type A sorting domain-containing protein [Neolewinella aurantiaca]